MLLAIPFYGISFLLDYIGAIDNLLSFSRLIIRFSCFLFFLYLCFMSLLLHRITCSRPVVIFNRGLVPCIKEFGYYKGDVFYSVPYCSDVFFSPFKLGLYLCDGTPNYDLIEQYYTINFHGDKQCLFLLCRCGHCDSCINSRTSTWSDRLQLEAIRFRDCPPMFLTVTYSNDYCDNNVHVEHIQKYLKRLRHIYPSLRYFFVSEYGSKNHRPHYHAVLFGLPIYDNLSYLDACDNFQRYWYITPYAHLRKDFNDKVSYKGKETVLRLFKYQAGFVRLEYLRDSKRGTRYVSKYVTKGSVVPAGRNKNFCLTSRRPMLGLGVLDESIVECVKNKSDLQFIDCFGSLQTIIPPLPLINKLFPSFCSATKQYRNLVSKLDACLNLLYFHHYPNIHIIYNFLRSLTPDSLPSFLPRVGSDTSFPISPDFYFCRRYRFINKRLLVVPRSFSSISFDYDYGYPYSDILRLIERSATALDDCVKNTNFEQILLYDKFRYDYFASLTYRPPSVHYFNKCISDDVRFDHYRSSVETPFT